MEDGRKKAEIMTDWIRSQKDDRYTLEESDVEKMHTITLKTENAQADINIYYQRKLIIIANNKSKAYDGTALSSSFSNSADYTVTGNMRGDTLASIEFDGSQTDAGESAKANEKQIVSSG